MNKKSIQDHYPDELNHCYGCGLFNEHGLHLKSYWDGDKAVANFLPRPYHMAVPGYVYGGLIASIIDCHGIGTAVAEAYRIKHREMGTEPLLIYVTASLQVTYLRPTPLGVPLELRGSVTEVKGRKIVVDVTVTVEGEVSAKGEVVAVQMPESMMFKKSVNRK
ncbi:PaaI family thioesterase [bacterium]|nr:PaaI family thioesterase [bacterium]